MVQAEFAAVLTRRRFCEVVGIHKTTLRRWEAAGVVVPRTETIMGSPTKVFEREDVVFGRRLVELLHQESGTVSVVDAARTIRERPRRSGG